MKRIFTLASMVLFTLAASAEGYQVNMQSAKQTGMGHVGTAMKLGSESIFFNPAAVAYMDSSCDISLGASAIFSTVDYQNGSYTATTDNGASTPLYGYAAFKIYDNLAAGISITNPYGSGMDWGKSWAGAELVQDISLQAFSVQPTLSYRITDKLSVGAGLMVYFGNVSISKALMPAGTLYAMGMGDKYATAIPVSADLEGDASAQFGYNLGLMYDVTSRLTIGATYRSKVDLEVSEGTSSLSYVDTPAQVAIASYDLLPLLDDDTFTAAMPMPANLTFGVAYDVSDRLLLSVDLQTVFWEAYQELDIYFINSDYTLSATKNYTNTIIARLGAEYALTERFDVRGGFYYDQTPVDAENLNPETPGMDKLGMSTGFSFRPTGFLSIDFAFLYIQGLSRYGSTTYTSMGQSATFGGDYKCHAIASSLGVSFKF